MTTTTATNRSVFDIDVVEGANTDIPVTVAPTAERALPQLSKRRIAATWAAAAIPMGVLSWVVAPIVARNLSGSNTMARALFVCLTIGLVWQGVLVLGLVAKEQGSIRWSVLREALWLRQPRSPRTGRTGGRVWWVVLPLVVLMLAEEMMTLPPVGGRDLGEFFQSTAGEQFFHGEWGWYGLLVVSGLFNTMLGEELLFRGYLLPRMNGAFGRKDWLVNGIMFGAYHLHTPWVIPASMFDAFVLSYPAKRYRSAWISIAVHSAQTVFFLLAGLMLVL